jgi:UDP:flavonoid glycosyltransferase YjiC (YdhE family)
MRVLFTSRPGTGHLTPVLSFARAFARAGDEVLFAVTEPGLAGVSAAGLEPWPLAAPPSSESDPILARSRGLSADEANALVARDLFASAYVRAALPGVHAAIRAWRPQLVVHDVAELAGSLAAERAGLPGVTVDIGLSTGMERFAGAVAAGVGPVRRDVGLPERAGPAGVRPEPRLTFAPAVLDGRRTRALRFREQDSSPTVLPRWWDADERPLVLLTLGSVAPTAGFFPGVFRAAIDALAALDARVLVTVGRDRDPAELGPMPASVRVERWVAQADVLPHVAAVACHGGSGTVLGALGAGRPVAVLPLFADQPYNARRVAELGVGLEVGEPAALGAAVERLLREPEFTARAVAVAADVRALPVVDAAPGMVHSLAAGEPAGVYQR